MKVSVLIGICILGLVGLMIYQSNQIDHVDKPFIKLFNKPSKKVSDKPFIQSAYQDCVIQTQQELVRDNPDSPSEIIEFLLGTAWQTCHSAVVLTCHKNFKSYSCQSIIEIYQPTES
jgi:hypothetical protein